MSSSIATGVIESQSQSIIPTTIRFVGDIFLGRHVETLMSRNGTAYVSNGLQSLPSVDFVVANFESAMANPHRQTPNMTFQFSTPAWALEVLDNLAVTHASLANNHGYDYGREGYINTREHLLARNIFPFGHPYQIATGTSIAVIETTQLRIGLLGIHTLFITPTDNDINSVMKFLNEISDVQVAYIHWGTEYELTSSIEQQQIADLLISAGIDLIIGHHPHVVQEIELRNGVPVFYSLGNLIFDQYFSQEVMDGLIVDLEINHGILDFNLIPVTSRDTRSQPRLMTDNEKRIFLENLALRSSTALYEMISAGALTIDHPHSSIVVSKIDE